VKSHPGTAWRSHTRPHKLSWVHLVDQQGDLFIHSFGHGTPRPGAKNKSQSQSQEQTPSVLSLSLSGKGKPKRPIQLACTWRLPISTLGIPRSRVRFAFERWSDPSPLDSSVGRARDWFVSWSRCSIVSSSVPTLLDLTHTPSYTSRSNTNRPCGLPFFSPDGRPIKGCPSCVHKRHIQLINTSYRSKL